MKRTELLKSTPCKVPEREFDSVIAVSQIVEQDGQGVLNIDLFYEGELRGRYFADSDVFNSFVDGKWYTCKMDNVARLCQGKATQKNDYYGCCREWIFETKKDEERAIDYLNTWSIEAYESSINSMKRDRATERKIKRINDMMASVPCVPDRAEEWVKDKVFPGNILFIKKAKTRTDYSCTACGSSGWKKKGWKHGEKTICPKCGQEVTANSRQKEKIKHEPVVILQIMGQQWVERQFKAVCTWTAKGKELFLYEQCRAIIPRGACWGKVWYGINREADEFEQDFWDKNPENKRFQKSYLWPGNLQEVLPFGHLENSGLDIMANNVKKMNVNKFITTFRQRPWLEYLAKAGLSRLVADVVDWYGWYGNPDSINSKATNLKDALRLDGNRVFRMKTVNGGLRVLEWLQYEAEKGIKISQEALQYLSDKNICIEECTEILDELKSVNRMVNYMKKQKIAPNRLTITWRDYLRMAANEGMNTEDDIVRLPKDLKTRHDHLVELVNTRRNAERMEREREKYAELDSQIMVHLPDAARYFYEDEKYMIIPAGKCEELLEEGKTLHHCVGASDTYMKKMAEGKTWICFLRKKEELQKAYYTLEIRMEDDVILQSYSEFDRRPDAKAINAVLEKFKKNVKKKREQAKIKVPLVNIA